MPKVFNLLSPRTPWRLFLCLHICCIEPSAAVQSADSLRGQGRFCEAFGKTALFAAPCDPECRLALLLPALEKSFANSALSVLSSPEKSRRILRNIPHEIVSLRR